MQKKIAWALLGAFIALLGFEMNAVAAPYALPEVGGGTGSAATSSAGQIPVSTGSSTYVPTTPVFDFPLVGTSTSGTFEGGCPSCLTTFYATAGEVPFSDGAGGLASDTDFSYDASTHILSVDGINVAVGPAEIPQIENSGSSVVIGGDTETPLQLEDQNSFTALFSLNDLSGGHTYYLPDSDGTFALVENSVDSFNGATGTITGVNSVNGATGTVSFGYVSSLNGATGTVAISSSSLGVCGNTNCLVNGAGYVTSTSAGSGNVTATGTVNEFPFYTATTTLSSTSSLSETTTGINESGTLTTTATNTYGGFFVTNASTSVNPPVNVTTTPDIFDWYVSSTDTSTVSIGTGTYPNFYAYWPIMKIGWNQSDTDGSELTALGYMAAGNLQPINGDTGLSGEWNTYIGAQSGYADATGHSNTAIGFQALPCGNGANYDTALGDGALGGPNFATVSSGDCLPGNFGDTSTLTYFTGSHDSVFGTWVAPDLTTGSYNTIGGFEGLYENTTGNNNTCLGFECLYNSSTTGSTVALGYDAGYNVTSTSNELFVNNVHEGSYAQDVADSLLYGKFAGTAGTTTGQYLNVNGGFQVNGNATTTGSLTVSSALKVGGTLNASGTISQNGIGVCLTSTCLQIANNLSDLASSTLARTNLGLGSIATHPTTDYLPSSTVYVSSYNVSSANNLLSSATTTTSTTLTPNESPSFTGTLTVASTTHIGGNLNVTGTISEAGATTTNCLTGILDPTPCVISFNGNTGTTTYSVTSTNAFISVTNNNSSSALTFSSSSLNLGSIATHPTSDFVTSSTGATFATSSNAAAGTYTNANITVNGNGIVTSASNGSAGGSATTTTVISGNALATTTASISGGNNTTTLTVNPTLASSSVSFNFYTPTTTAGYNSSYLITSNKKTITHIDCADQTATTTVTVGYATSLANAAAGTMNQIILSSLVCGAGNSTTSFTTSTLPANDYLLANVTSTAGTPTHATVSITATSQ